MEPTCWSAAARPSRSAADVTVSVHADPGPHRRSVAYVVDGQDDVFVGDAVQVHGAANGFPGYEDPDAYRASLSYLRDEVRPRHLYLGHPYRTPTARRTASSSTREQAREALQESLDIEARVRRAQRYLPHGLQETDSPYSPFAGVAEELGYTGDPTLEPSPFFTTLHGYAPRNRSYYHG